MNKIKKENAKLILKVKELEAELNEVDGINKDDKQMHKIELDVIAEANNKGFILK